MTQHPEPERFRPWETYGTRDYTDAERAMHRKVADIMVPDPHHWADLIDTRPRQNGKMAEHADRHLAGIITSAPTSIEVRFDPEVFALAMDTIRKARETYERTRYVVGRVKWHAILDAASPELRAELDSLAKSGTVIVSDLLPDPDTAYRIQLPEPPAGCEEPGFYRFPRG